MKKPLGFFAACAIAFISIASAQSAPPMNQGTSPPNSRSSTPASSPSPSDPSAGMNDPRDTGTGNYSNGSQDGQWQMKDCISKQKAKSPTLTQEQMTQNCRKQQPHSDAGH